MVNLLYYDFIAEFKRNYYKDLLSIEHLVGSQVKIDKMSYPDGSIDDCANFWGYVLEKNGTKYLLSGQDKEGRDVKIGDLFPIYPKDLLKVASKGNVYYWIKRPVCARIKPEKSMSYKDMVDTFASLKHSNQTHTKLMWFITLTQMYDRANFRISTPAGFGKDSAVEIMNNLIGKANTIENPTLAKLEFMSVNKLLAVNEVVDIKKSDWRTMEQFLLSTGAHKPAVTKHSRAIASGVGEVLDVSNLSLSLMYNDIDHYPSEELYFDYVTKEAVMDRFPALRLHGEFTENFNDVKDYTVEKFVKEHYQEYITLIRNYEYYRIHHMKYYHNYTIENLLSLPKRWRTNIGRLLKFIDIYCDTNEEFQTWVQEVNKSIVDYKEMLKYPQKLKDAHKFLGPEDFTNLHKKLVNILSFKDKNIVIAEVLNKTTKQVSQEGNLSIW
jgi:hypothetical protein